MRILRWTVFGLGGLAVLVTVLPFIPSNASAVRVWDFPRFQVAVLLAAVLVATPFLSSLRHGRTWGFAAALVGALAWQAYAIWPYTPLAETEVKAPAAASRTRGSRCWWRMCCQEQGRRATAGPCGTGQPGPCAARGNRRLVGPSVGTAKTGLSSCDKPAAGKQLRHPSVLSVRAGRAGSALSGRGVCAFNQDGPAPSLGCAHQSVRPASEAAALAGYGAAGRRTASRRPRKSGKRLPRPSSPAI